MHLVRRRNLISTVVRCQRGVWGAMGAAIMLWSGGVALGAGASRAPALARPTAIAPPHTTRHWEVAATPIYAYLLLDSGSEPRGGGVRLEARRAITPEYAVQVTGFYSAHRVTSADPSLGQRWSGVWGLTSDAVYLVDRARWVPRVEGGLGLLWLGAAVGKRAAVPALHLGLGLDYAPRPWLALGLVLHYYGHLERPLDLPTYVQLGPRLAARW